MTPKGKPTDQDEAIERAFVAGTLPEEDRREDEDRREQDRRAPVSAAEPEPEPEPVVESVTAETPSGELITFVAEDDPPIPNDQIHVIKERADGVKTDAAGHILI